MEFFHKAKVVRIGCPQHEKYLVALEDQESVTQDRNGSSKQARWTVEFVPGSNSFIRLRSCYGKYLTASEQPLFTGLTGQQVLQTLPARLDSQVEWEPIKCGSRMKLRSRHGHSFLRGNGGLPPWRNTVTHFTGNEAPVSHLEWNVDILEIHEGTTSSHIRPPPPPYVHVNGNARPPASGHGNISYMPYAMLAVNAANLGTGLVGPMQNGADANGHPAGVADTNGVSDVTGVANAAGVMDPTGVSGVTGVADAAGVMDPTGVSDVNGVADAAGVMDPTGVADVTTVASGGVDGGGLADVASNCPMM